MLGTGPREGAPRLHCSLYILQNFLQALVGGSPVEHIQCREYADPRVEQRGEIAGEVDHIVAFHPEHAGERFIYGDWLAFLVQADNGQVRTPQRPLGFPLRCSLQHPGSRPTPSVTGHIFEPHQLLTSPLAF